MERLLSGKKVAVLVETGYIHKEIAFYRSFFERYGAKVDFMTYLRGMSKRELMADCTELTGASRYVNTMTVYKDIEACDPNDYAIVLVAANYVECKLREVPEEEHIEEKSLVTQPAAVSFMEKAMANSAVVKGTLCHALWLLTPTPELLKDRNVICHTMVLADVINAGANYIQNNNHVLIDKDLVTANTTNHLKAYGDAIIKTYKTLNNIDQGCDVRVPCCAGLF